MKQINSYVEKVRADRFRIWQTRKPCLAKLDIELTERCNNNCIHCYINQPADDKNILRKELGTKEVKNIIEEAAALGCLTIKFTGGEPLLREDFEDIYIHTRRLGIKVVLFTNATLITPTLADLFAKIPPLEKIEISYYGMRKSSYETISRVSGSYEAASRGINLLVENNVPFALKNVLLPPAMQEVEEFEGWASHLPGINEKPAYTFSINLRCRRDSDKKNSQIKKLRLAPDKIFTFLARNKAEFSQVMQEFCTKFMGVGGRCLFTCGAGMRGGAVDAYGRFQLCLLLRHPETVYNLGDGNLREAVVEFAPDIRTREGESNAYLTRCARCFLKGFCDQCPGKSWIEHGTLDTPVEYLCDVAHTNAKCIGLIGESEKAWEVDDWGQRIERISIKSNILETMGDKNEKSMEETKIDRSDAR